MSGRVWNDQNNNGLQELPEEAGLPNLDVYLDPATLRTMAPAAHPQRLITRTDASGDYRFDVAPGSYVVSVSDPAGYWPTTHTSVDVTLELHVTVIVNVGYYKPPFSLYLPVITRNR